MIGQTLKHYEIESLLGKGGMGEVYRARDTRLGRAVALKVLPREFVADPDRRARFLQEARAAAAVNHPAIAQVYDVDEVEGSVIFVMELVEGKSLRALIQNRELDTLGALELAVQIAGGLAKAHEVGIIHRDIKPENVVVTPDGHAKILDFGLAKLRDPATPQPDDVSHMETLAKTQAGMILGTLRYMSPEQARGHAVDHRSDIFSLGVVIYEMVTGQPPFGGSTPLDTLHAIAFEETTPVTTVRANLPPSVQRVITRCLRKQAKDRYPDARELAADLKLVQREIESGVSTPVPFLAALQQRFLGAVSGRDRTLFLAVSAAAALLLVSFLLRRGVDAIPTLATFAILGIFIYRRIRNRRYYRMRALASKLRKLPEVRVVVADGTRVTVVADKALAKTYVRANAIVNAINARMLHGEALSVVVKDNVPDEELRALLQSPGVLYVRDDE